MIFSDQYTQKNFLGSGHSTQVPPPFVFQSENETMHMIAHRSKIPGYVYDKQNKQIPISQSVTQSVKQSINQPVVYPINRRGNQRVATQVH